MQNEGCSLTEGFLTQAAYEGLGTCGGLLVLHEVCAAAEGFTPRMAHVGRSPVYTRQCSVRCDTWT